MGQMLMIFCVGFIELIEFSPEFPKTLMPHRMELLLMNSGGQMDKAGLESF